MPIFVLYMSAECEGVKSITPQEGIQWCFDFKASDCDEEKKNVYISTEEEVEIEGSKGTANFVYKWPDTKKHATINIQEIKKLTRSYTGRASVQEDGDKMVPIMGFECRNLELTKWHPGPGFTVVSESGKRTFEDVDLGEEWSEYDDSADQAMSIMNVKYEFKTHRGA